MGVIRRIVAEGEYLPDVENNDYENEQDRENDGNNLNSQLEAEHIQAQEDARIQRNRIRRLRTQQKKSIPKAEPTFRGLGCRGKSYKKYRRFENANLIDEDEEDRPITIYDFVPESVSVFAQFLVGQENMKAWDDFIEWSEKEMMNNHKIIYCSEGNDPDDDNDGHKSQKSKRKNGKCTNNVQDKRQTHPGYSGKECFERIDGKIKQMLKRNRIPLGLLENIENEIVDFFLKDPGKIYKSCLSSGYHRLVLHACSQYHNLKCKSFDDQGSRWSHVNNPNDKFIPPIINLTNYLGRSKS